MFRWILLSLLFGEATATAIVMLISSSLVGNEKQNASCEVSCTEVGCAVVGFSSCPCPWTFCPCPLA